MTNNKKKLKKRKEKDALDLLSKNSATLLPKHLCFYSQKL